MILTIQTEPEVILHLTETNEAEIAEECKKYSGCTVVITEDDGTLLEVNQVENIF